jgi:hypothetical protein
VTALAAGACSSSSEGSGDSGSTITIGVAAPLAGPKADIEGRHRRSEGGIGVLVPDVQVPIAAHDARLDWLRRLCNG